jgi:hypothetical protein
MRLSTDRMQWRRAAHAGTAAVWAHQGLWCKVLGRDESHRAVIETVPGPIGTRADQVTRALGVAETALAVLVATNGRRRWVAAVETALVAAFNAGGLLLGREHISHPARLLARNSAFIALIWSGVE